MRIGPIHWMPASEMRVEATPLARYQAVYPERYVQWNVGRQCWEVRARDAITGYDERIAFVRDLQDDGTWSYAPFDDAYVSDILRQRWAILEQGAAAFVAGAMDRNRVRERQRLLSWQDEKDYFLRHERRWVPALAAAHRKRWAYSSELASERVPLVAGGLTR